MRRTGESSQYHDETPRRRVRRPQTQDLERLQINEMKGRAQEMAENSPTSPFKAGPFVLPQSPSSMQNPVSPHRHYPQHNPRSQSAGIPHSPLGYPHSAVSPSRYPPAPPIYMSVPSPSSGISTPSCATPTSSTSIPSPDFFSQGMAEGTIPMSPSKADPSYPIRSPSYYQTDHKSVYSEGQPFNYPQGPSPGGTIHHLGYNRPVPVQPGFSQATTMNPRMAVSSSAGSLHPPQSPVYRTPQGVNHEHLSGNPSGRKYSNQPPPMGKPPDSPETARLRQLVIEYYNNEKENVKTKYYEKLQELFFLQNGGNIMDILIWKRRPSPQLTNFINSNKLEDGLMNLNSTPSGNPSLGIWQQQSPLDGNPEFANVPRQGNEQLTPGVANPNPSYYPEGFPPNVSPFTGNHMGMKTGQNIPPLSRSLSMPNAPINNPAAGSHVNHHTGNRINTPTHSSVSNSSLNRSMSVGGQPVANGPTNVSNPSNPSNRTNVNSDKNISVLSVLDNSFGSHEEIAVEAKKEAEVLKRVSELRKEGLWSTRRLPKVQEMSRKKAHWDYLLEEMQWLATDFAQERRWKRGVAKKLSRSVLKHHQEQRSKEVKAEKEETVRLKRIASSIAREVKQFWSNVEKVVQYKVQSRLEEQRKKALDVQLNFIVDQTEKYSSWLAESLKNQPGSGEGSTAPTSPVSASKADDDDDDEEFDVTDESDVEETILEEEKLEQKEQTDHDRQQELELLQQDNEMTLEELLDKLPPEMLRPPSEASDDSDGSSDDSDADQGSNESNESDIEVDVESKDQEEKKPKDAKLPLKSSKNEEKTDTDTDFVMEEEEDAEDDEQTLDEQEKTERGVDHDKEIAELEKEGDMPLDELMKQYATGEDTTDFPSEEESSEESSEEEEAEESGMEFLVRKDGTSDAESDPDQELTSAAATAESLQPTGFTLETAHVQTKVPMLLRGNLREYQVIGLDWLVTMHGKCLNGILADEMGLGKTIQTIALLAHLACDKGIWGPHLVVVPTSVMLNWEMEFKKWLPGFKILTYYGNQKERKAKRQGWTKPNAFHVCITSYKLVIQDHQAFRRKKWKYFILDEAQNIKNFKSQRWQYLLNFNSQRRLLLTGTPLQNSLMELWSLMHFLMPHLFQSHKDFKEWFSNPLTGMIEGSREYNENLVKRLHKVLRPFLLRRLKSEVEKQMPQKYEHVYRCRLSKRQRFLYDDFMSRTKTKETLESGHFLSVINILMQLRKVCNHPDLFEPRPTVSSLKLPGIVYSTSSLVLRALECNPFDKVSFGFLNLCLADIELTVTSYAAYRTQSLQTPKQLITEIDTTPDQPKPIVPPAKPRKMVGTGQQLIPQGVPYDNSRAHPTVATTYTANQQQDHRAFPPVGSPYGSMMWYQDGLPYGPRPGVPMSVQPRMVPPVSSTMPHSYQSRLPSDLTRTHFPYGLPAKMMGPPPPYPGHSVAVAPSQSLESSIGYLEQRPPIPSPIVQQGLQGVAPSRSLDAGQPELPKPVQISPSKKLAVERQSTPQITPPLPQENKNSPFYLPELSKKQAQQRKEKLASLALVNTQHCRRQPVYGLDLVQAVSFVKGIQNQLRGVKSETMEELIKSHEQRISDMTEIINRFVICVPHATSPGITMHCSHPPPHYVNHLEHLETTLTKSLHPKFDSLHSIARGMTIQFPEARLIQYDCGKLQTLDILLRQLKVGKHRVLIFTQMTKMLDVLEKFLNHHGHVYLRLDGSTRVEQRQILMDRFNADTRIFCFILSTRSGGLGVNLTGADTVIFYDSDWNPTMDAQAQDRCHRIGQTRDVHIYRLVCERTVEENILKKANQKRLLGDIAIEGGNFTTAFFRETSLKELFTIDNTGGLEAAVASSERQPKPVEEEECQETETESEDTKKEENEQKGKVQLNLFEQALLEAEDEQDACAATKAKAEEAAELAEFDEGIPYNDEATKERDEESSRVELELMQLDSQLTPIERYAVKMLEMSGAYATLEQIKEEEQVELAKKDWEMDHILALKEEEEKRAAEDEDEIFFTYETSDSTQVKKSKTKSKTKPKSKQSKPSSKASSVTSSSKKKSPTKNNSTCAGSQETVEANNKEVRPSRPPRRMASRASSRSSSCSSTSMVTRRNKPRESATLDI